MIGKLNSKTCDKLDPIPTKVVKDCVDELLPVIRLIVNQVLASGVYPDALKEGAVTPILKKRDLDSEILKHYRPVTQNSFLNKVVDREIQNQMTEYLKNANLESPFQAGYRKNHSTETLLTALYDNMLKDFDDGKAQILITLDFSSAFDCIRVNQLTETLEEEFGFKETALE